jgi:hypothetical protein
MDIQSIVADLTSELHRLGQVIGLLEGNGNAPAKKRVGRPPGSVGRKAASGSKGHGLTSAGRRKLSLAMKARWAKRKSANGSVKASAPISASAKSKKRGGMTPAGRKRISEAMKKRWAEKRKSS